MKKRKSVLPNFNLNNTCKWVNVVVMQKQSKWFGLRHFTFTFQFFMSHIYTRTSNIWLCHIFSTWLILHIGYLSISIRHRKEINLWDFQFNHLLSGTIVKMLPAERGELYCQVSREREENKPTNIILPLILFNWFRTQCSKTFHLQVSFIITF